MTTAVVRAIGRRRGFGAPVAAVAHKTYFVLPLMTDIPAFWIFDHSCIPHKPYNQVDNIFIYINIPSQARYLFQYDESVYQGRRQRVPRETATSPTVSWVPLASVRVDQPNAIK